MSLLDKISNNNEKKEDTYKVAPIPERLKKNKKVVMITADNTEDLEFFYPYYRLTEEGYTVDVVTPDGGKFAGKHDLGLSETKAITAVKPADYELLYLPGGKAPSELRKNEDVLAFVKEFARNGKPIAAVCHGPQVLISAGLVKGKQMAAWPEVGKELTEAGATYVDEALVEDGQFITARKPGDLHRHLYGTLQYLRGEVEPQNRTQRRSQAG
ncbi:MAG TPA: type 1 glutamine amidotransferase domain-containing protein [Rickettsiales bacterium]|nr:type 1 glutamine amidotransferase domain-containing protein [Rickettsiales bacterium]